MYFPGNYPELIELLLEQYNTTTELFTRSLPESDQQIELSPGTPYSHMVTADQIGLITDGYLQASLGEKVIFILHASDLIYSLSHPAGVRLQAEDPTAIRLWQKRAFFDYLSRDAEALNLWQKSILLQNNLFIHAYAFTTRNGIRPQAGFSRFVDGEVIIRQGEPADCVYTLLRGEARVSVQDDVEVGWIHEGEIFGVIGALTDQPRTATVTASGNCTVMAVPKEQFVDLIHAQPATAVQLLQTLARKIVDMNQKLMEKETNYN